MEGSASFPRPVIFHPQHVAHKTRDPRRRNSTESRLKLIDLVMSVASEQSCIYLTTVFVPTLGESKVETEQMRNVKVLNRLKVQEDDDKTNEENSASDWADHDVLPNEGIEGDSGESEKEDEVKFEWRHETIRYRLRIETLDTADMW